MELPTLKEDSCHEILPTEGHSYDPKACPTMHTLSLGTYYFYEYIRQKALPSDANYVRVISIYKNSPYISKLLEEFLA